MIDLKHFVRPSRKFSFFKYTGGKNAIVPMLMQMMPENYNDYHEPFFGSGAFFYYYISSNRERIDRKYYISDNNPLVMITHKALRDDYDNFIKEAERLHAIKEQKVQYKTFFKQLQKNVIKDYNSEEYPIGVTGAQLWFIFDFAYLAAVKYKDDHTMYATPTTMETDLMTNIYMLKRCHDILQKAQPIITVGSFTDIQINKGDFYYFDPPYHESTFNDYRDNSLKDDDIQNDLLDICKRIDEAGAYFMQSNNATHLMRELYKDFHQEEFSLKVNRSGAPAGAKKGTGKGKKRQEILIMNYKYKKQQSLEL